MAWFKKLPISAYFYSFLIFFNICIITLFGTVCIHIKSENNSKFNTAITKNVTQAISTFENLTSHFEKISSMTADSIAEYPNDSYPENLLDKLSVPEEYGLILLESGGKILSDSTTGNTIKDFISKNFDGTQKFILSKENLFISQQIVIPGKDKKLGTIFLVIDKEELCNSLIFDSDLTLKLSDKKPEQTLGNATLYSSFVNTHGLHLGIYVDYNAISQPIKLIIPLIFLAVILVLFNVFALIFKKKFCDSISYLDHSMVSLKNESYEKNQDILFTKELCTLKSKIDDIDSAIFELNRQNAIYEKSLFEKEISSKKIQYRALKNQINPHFIYNTLSCVNGIALCNNQNEIAEICSCMAKILRYSVSEKDTASVKEELDVIRAYLYIQSTRFLESFSYTINVDEKILNYQIIRFILQPIVENAIIHGIEPKKVKGTVSIEGFESDGMIVFKISDNGIGIPSNILMQMQKNIESATGELPSNSEIETRGSGIGLANISNRIKLFYGKEYGIVVNSAVNMGTYITIKLPAL